MRIAVVSVAIVACAAQDVTFSTGVRLVNVFASVRDRDGHIVKDLTKDDFVLKEDGHLQTIRHFSQESNLPLILGLLVDTSRSMQTVFEPERAASNRFLEQILREDRDRAFVMHFDVRVGVLQGLTSSREELAEALDRLKIPRLPATKLYDAIQQGSEEIMRPEKGRKAFILLSDGMDVRSEASLGSAIEYAQRADTMIYSVLFDHPGGRAQLRNIPVVNVHVGPKQRRGPAVMARLARETGGGFFTVSEENTIDKIYAQIEDELRHQYSIGYVSNRRDSNDKYRKITLTLKRKGLTVQTRDGYYPN